MPRIELGDTLEEIIDCQNCGRTVFVESGPGKGFLADCGRRLVNIKECSRTDRICPEPE